MPDKRFVTALYSHDPQQLVNVAGLQGMLDAESERDPQFAVNWAVVKDWSVESRYRLCNEAEARTLHTAVMQRHHGVMRWIRTQW